MASRKSGAKSRRAGVSSTRSGPKRAPSFVDEIARNHAGHRLRPGPHVGEGDLVGGDARDDLAPVQIGRDRRLVDEHDGASEMVRRRLRLGAEQIEAGGLRGAAGGNALGWWSAAAPVRSSWRRSTLLAADQHVGLALQQIQDLTQRAGCAGDLAQQDLEIGLKGEPAAEGRVQGPDGPSRIGRGSSRRVGGCDGAGQQRSAARL